MVHILGEVGKWGESIHLRPMHLTRKKTQKGKQHCVAVAVGGRGLGRAALFVATDHHLDLLPNTHPGSPLIFPPYTMPLPLHL